MPVDPNYRLKIRFAFRDKLQQRRHTFDLLLQKSLKKSLRRKFQIKSHTIYPVPYSASYKEKHSHLFLKNMENIEKEVYNIKTPLVGVFTLKISNENRKQNRIKRARQT